MKDPAPSSTLRPLAHELRNAIAPVRNAAHLLRKRASADPIVATAVQTIDSALNQSLKLLDRAVDAERVMRGEVSLASTDVDVASIVQQAIAECRAALDEKAQHVRVDIRATAPRVRGDTARLTQVVATLVANASRYSDERSQIDVVVESRDHDVLIRVRDRGAGISAAFLPRVFEPFAQCESDSARAGSVAMSLPVARKLVDLHGGRLEATSDGADRGSEFIVTLRTSDAHESAAEVPQPTSGEARKRGAPRRVLLVDDNRAVRETYADVLEDLGCEVETAVDGEQALSRALQWRPRFVVLDINLPKRNGYEVARALRERFSSKAMTLVMISGTLLDEATLESARAAGFDHCIDKASDLAVLERVLGAA